MNVVDLPIISLANVASQLRNLADRVEAKGYGEVGCCAVVLLADKLHVMAWGADSGPPSAACVLQAGAHRLIEPLLEHGYE